VSTFKHILVAADESESGLHAVKHALRLAGATGASLSILTVRPAMPANARSAGRLVATGADGKTPLPAELMSYLGWVKARVPIDRAWVEVGVAYGVPGIEICRLAEERGSDLIVLGRRPRSPAVPLVLGETADAVVRRSPVPVLFVPVEVPALQRLLVAMDGSGRTAKLFQVGSSFARAVGARVSVVTVEPVQEPEPMPLVPSARSVRLQEMLATSAEPAVLSIRRGDPIRQLLAEAETAHPDVVVVGYRRGGPSKVVEPTEVARNVLYAAPCAVLTVPV
jgi:nucleotide-binding universal stress UspA family protein